MSRLILPGRATQGPQQGMLIDRSNPITQGLVSAVFPTAEPTLRDFVSGLSTADPYAPSDPSFKYTGIKQQGRWRNTGSGSYKNTTAVIGPLSNQYTTIVFVRPLAVNTGTAALIGSYQAASSWTLGEIDIGSGTAGVFMGQSVSGVAAGQVVSDAAYTVGNFYCVAYTADYANGIQHLFVNGAQQSGVGTYTSPAGHQISTGVLQAASAYAEFYGAMFFTRILSPSEINAITANPWQIVKGSSRRLWVAAAASSGAVVASGFDATAGAMLLGGAGALSSLAGLDAASGGVSIAGSAILSAASLDAASSGALFSGSALLSASGLDAVVGAMNIGGGGQVAAVGLDATAALVSISASAAVAVAAWEASAGSVHLAGAGSLAVLALDAEVGASAVTGRASLQASGFDVSTGNIGQSSAAQIAATAATVTTASLSLQASGLIAVAACNASFGAAHVVGAGSASASGLDAPASAVHTAGVAQLATSGAAVPASSTVVVGIANMAIAANDALYAAASTSSRVVLSIVALNAAAAAVAVSGTAPFTAVGDEVALGTAFIAGVSPTDPRRIYRIPAEVRVAAISADLRTMAILA